MKNMRTQIIIISTAQMLWISIWHMRKSYNYLNIKMWKFQFMISLCIKGMLFS